jgi:hypothetical protein
MAGILGALNLIMGIVQIVIAGLLLLGISNGTNEGTLTNSDRTAAEFGSVLFLITGIILILNWGHMTF